MRQLFICLLITSLQVYPKVYAQEQCPIIPLPADVQKTGEIFTFTPATSVIVTHPSLLGAATYLKERLQTLAGIKLAKHYKVKDKYIELKLVHAPDSSAHAYHIHMYARRIVISAADEEALFNGIVSFLQLVAQAPQKKEVSVSCWTIHDAPRYAWRGLMLDESRHFFGKATVKRLLDQMAFYKLNRFHWHLTDEPAWRLEIRQYPRLATVGGRGNYSDSTAAAQYYTQADIREIIAYAEERHITVIPEIDMPGHATAANKAYPEFSGGGSKNHLEFTFDPGKEATYSYLTGILKEVKDLFPAGMIHLGGDEVSFGNDRWKENPGIQRLMREQSLGDITAVEQYFVKRMADSINAMKYDVLGWDEVVHANLIPEKTVVFWWRQENPGQLSEALKKQYAVVVCPRLPFYFDFVQDSTHQKGRKWNRLYNSLADVYAFSHPQRVLGIQANVWTETMRTPKRLEFMLFPRMLALAETAWTRESNKDFKQFEARLRNHLLLLKQAGIYYYDPQNPAQTPEPLQ